MKWKTIQFQDYQWNYVVAGNKGSWLLVLPGGTRRPGLKSEFLQDLIKEFRVISPAYPRIGRMKPLADGIAHILKEEGIDTVHAYGSSFGGIMAQVFFMNYPSFVDKVIISNTDTITEDRQLIKRIRNGQRFLRLLPAFLVRSIMLKQFGKLMDVLGDQKAEYETSLASLIHSRKLDKPDIICHFNCLMDFQDHFDSQSTATFQSKMLIISAENDTGVGGSSIENLHRVYPAAQFYHFEDGGHFPMIIHKTRYLNLLKSFLLD
ncbi:MAG: alpha/beta fold hydrolase [Candidatus Hermodarchaeota archaeon]